VGPSRQDPGGEAAEPSDLAPPDQPRNRPILKPPGLAVVAIGADGQAVDLVLGEGVVFILDERDVVVVIVGGGQIIVLGEIDADVVGHGRGGRIDVVPVLVGDQGRVVDHRVQFRRVVGLGLESILGFRLGGGDDFFLVGLVFGRIGSDAAAAIAQRLLGIKLRAALGADGRPTAEIVEFRGTCRANLLCTQFGICQFGDLLLMLACGGGSLAMAGGDCQNQTLPSRKTIRMTIAASARPIDSPTTLTARSGAALRGRVQAPGDKSISHRALILGALASGVTEITGLLEGDDVRRTAAAMSAFGAKVERLGPGHWRVTGAGTFSEPGDIIDCGNAGTGARLIIGAAAGFDLTASFTGDKSLRGRPMGRVLKPLGMMGARWLCREGPRLPLSLHGGGLKAIDYPLPEPSAQVKSAVLLAGLQASGVTRVIEPVLTRDHTERMLRAFGARVDVADAAEGRVISLLGGQTLRGAPVNVPGDPSSAAFPIVAALVTPGSEVRVDNVLLNPLRIGLIDTLVEMGADISIENARESGGERVGDIIARQSPLRGVTVPSERAASMIDEYPILAVAAAHARGPTVMRGLGELRVKESDRIALMAQGLAACGVQVEEEAEGLTVMGVAQANHRIAGGARTITHGDHRIAMSFLVLGLGADQPIGVDEPGMIATSFPGFTDLMTGLGAHIDAE